MYFEMLKTLLHLENRPIIEMDGDENEIKKVPKKPYPTAKWLNAYSTPINGFAVASNKSKFIMT